MERGRGANERDRTVLVLLTTTALCVAVGVAGVAHYHRTTSAEWPSVGHCLVFAAYASVPWLPLQLFSVYTLVLPLVVPLFLAYGILTTTPSGPDGAYPGRIVVLWPASLVAIAVLAGVDVVLSVVWGGWPVVG
ncbi:hypothetical protein [Salinigranum sp.]|uniref:hypothetical protein n=1 Tax=Salinigranum sp. TaxID=1966351 RepID=UPI003564417B